MPRRPGRACGQLVFHVLNRAIQNTVPFLNPDDYCEFLGLVGEGIGRFSVRILAYTVMPNHWHLVVWPTTDDGLSHYMHWLTGRHAQQWRRRRGSQGRGAVYQGRFKAVAVQCDDHFLRLCRYVERNPLRARLVVQAEDWPWSSASQLALSPGRPALSEWPVPKPVGWTSEINDPGIDPWLARIRRAIRRNEHLGDRIWREATTQRLGWRSGRGPGRPPGPTRAASADNSVIDFRS